MEKKVILTYRKGDILNGCRLNLTKELVNILMLTEEKRELIFEFKDKTIFLMAATTEIEEIKNIENGEIKYLKTIIKAGYEKGKNNYKLSIPLQIAKAMQLDKIPMVIVDIKNNIIEIKKSTQKIESLKKEKKINKNGKIYMITVKKGGSAKTFTAIQIAYFLAVIKRSKVLLISSDTSNDHLFNLLTVEEAQELSKNNNVSIDKTGKITIKKGLKHLVLSEKIDYSDYTIEARENLDVIPLESDIFRLTTAEEFTDYQNYMLRFPKVMKKLRNLYDYIIIDGIPVSNIDDFYTEVADKFIIPIVPDEATIRGAINLVQKIGATRIHAIMVSKYRKTAAKDEYLELLNNWIKKTSIIYPEPIKELAQIEQLIKNKKTIFESESKYLLETQKSFIRVSKDM
ncbi:ParA family protein (plasmid) [Fusobacterium sp. SB021]|uniref:ParA family protein n=1 Tax=Fusobacterium sp. SB021 TaxID=2744227 RepID=UPI003CFAA8C3